MKKHYSNKKMARKPLIMALEPRLLLDGAAVSTAVDVITDAQLHQDAFQSISSDAGPDTFAGIAPTETRSLDQSRNSGKKEVVFIESNVTDYQTLLNGVKEGVEVVLLDAGKDGLAQMAAWAEGKSGYDSVHIISHGSEGQIQLGTATISQSTLSSDATALASLGRALGAEGDILLYGCGIAETQDGKQLLQSLSQLTGADIAASTDLTGSALQGADWLLEATTGQVTAQLSQVIDNEALASFSGILAPDTLVVTTANDTSENADDAFGNGSYEAELADGGGLSLREALGLAQAGGFTISFAAGLDGSNISLDSNLTVADGTIFQLHEGTSFIISGSDLFLEGALTIDNASGNTLTLSASLTDGNYDVSTLNKTGAGTLVLSGTNNSDATGLDTITATAGTLQVGADANLGTGNVILSGGATFATANNVLNVDNTFAIQTGGATFNQTGSGHLTLSGVVEGDSLLTKAGAGTMTFLSTNDSFFGGVTINNGTVNAASANESFGYDGTVTLNGGTLVISNDTSFVNNILVNAGATLSNSTDVTLEGGISGSGALTKAGSGTMTWSGSNSHSGAVTVSAGTLAVSGGSSIGDSSAVTVNSGATLSLTGGAETIGSLSGAGNVALGSYRLTIGGDGSNTIFSGVISGTGSGITKVGSGSLTLSGANTYTGATTISAGTLYLENGSAIADSSSVTISSGAELELRTSNETIGSLAGAGTLTLNGGNLTVGGNNTSTTFSGVIQDGDGGGGLIKTGSGTLTLSGANTHTGFVTVSAGTLALSGGSSIGNDSAVQVDSGATLSLTGGAETIGSLSGAGAVSLGYALTLGNASSTVFSGVISSTNTSGITKVGSGTLQLTGANTYTGATTVSAGKLLLQGGSAIADSSAVTVNSGAEIELRTSDETIGSLAGAGTLTLNGGNLTVGGNNSDTTFSGQIQDGGISGGLIKAGTGTLTLTAGDGINTYSGGTTVAAGTLTISRTSHLGTGTVTLDGGTLQLISGGNFSFSNAMTNAMVLASDSTIDIASGVYAKWSNVISGSGSLTKTGSGSLGVTAVNTYTGDTTLSEGAIVIDSATATLGGADADNGNAYGTLIIHSGAHLDFNYGATIANDLVIGGVGVGYGAIQAGFSGTDVIFTGAVTLSSDTLVDPGNITLEFSGGISDGGNGYTLSNAWNGTVKLSGTANNWTGGISTVANHTGKFSITNASNIGSGQITLNGGGLIITGAATLTNEIAIGSGGASVDASHAVTLSGLLSGSGAFTKLGAGTLTLSGSNTHSGAVTVSAGTLAVSGGSSIGDSSAVTVDSGATLSLTDGAETIGSLSGAGNVALGSYGLTLGGDGSNTAFSGVISGTGSGITKVGSGSLTLSGANTYTGATTISAGTLYLENGSAIADSSSVTISSGAELELRNSNETIGSLSGSGTLTLNGGTLTTGGNGTSTTFSGVIQDGGGDNGGLTKTGSGTFTLTGSNTYTGVTTVSAGTLFAGSDTALGATTAGTTASSGGKLELGNGVNIAEAVSIAGNGGLVMTSGSATLSGNLTLTADARVTVDSGAMLTSSGTWGGAYTAYKFGTGSLILSGTNSGASTTNLTVSAGTLSITNASNLIGGTLTLNTGASGSLTVTGSDVTISKNIALGVSGGRIVNANGLTISGVISGTGALFKAGDGTLTLDATNTYTGATTVSAGILLVNGSLGSTSGLTVASGATLGGTGSIFATNSSNTLTVANGATLSPGVAGSNGGVGSLTVNGNLLLSSGSTLATDIAGTTAGSGYDQVVVNGTVSLNGASLTTALAYSPIIGDVFRFISNDGSDANTGTFTGLAEGAKLTPTGTTGFELTAYYAASDAGATSGGNDFMLAFINAAPTLTVGATVSLADAANGLTAPASTIVTDAEGNWTNGTLTIERVTPGGTADGNANDVFSFLSGLTVTGGPIVKGMDGSGTLSDGTTVFASWAYSSATGRLVITFESVATTAQVQTLVQNIGYSNATPYGDANIRLTLIDDMSGNVATGTITVTSNLIYVDTNSDDGDGDAADGFSLREALARGVSQTGSDTIKVVLSDNSTITLGSAVTAGAGDTLDLDTANGLTITGSSISIDSGNTLTISNGSNDTATIRSTVTGAGNLAMAGAGTLTLDATNTYTGSTSVTDGTLKTNAAGINATSGLTLNGGTLSTLNSSISKTLAISLGSNGGTLDVSGGSMTLSGVISGVGGLTLRSTNAGNAVTLSGANTYTGGTALSSGILSLESNAAVGTGALTIDGGKVRSTGAERTLANDLVINNTFVMAGSYGLTFTGAVDLAGGTRTFNNQLGTGKDLTLSGVISNGNLTVASSGQGQVVLSGSNTYAVTSVTSGTLSVTGDSNLGSGAVTVNGGTLVLTGSAVTIDNSIVIGSNGGSVSTAGNVVLSGGISGDGAFSKAGSGTLTINGNSIHTGSTLVTSGVLAVTGGNGIGDYSAVTVASGATLELQTANETIGSLAGAGAVTLNGGTLTLGQNNTSTTFSGAINEVEMGALVKIGSGTLTLSGTNAYTGTTIVSAGTLSVLGALSSTSGVTVLSGATLGGTGSIFANGSNNTLTVAQGGTLAPGVSGGGVFTINGNLSLNGILKADIAGAMAGIDYDQVVVKGYVALGAESSFDINYTATGSAYSYVLIDNDANEAITGTLNGVADYGLLPSPSSDLQVRYQGGTGNDVTLTVNLMPEVTSGATGSVDENAATSTVIYTATATDADSNTLTYSLSGADADLLTIDSVTGEVRLKDSANFEAKSSYSFTVVVTDSGNLSAGKAVTVSVGDLNETPVLTSGATGSVTENAATSTVIYTATATDADSNTLTYSLSGADADLLTIDAVTGEVRLKDSANFEAKSSYSFSVIATDNGSGLLNDSKAVTVNVVDVNETPVLTSGATGSVTENAATSTVIYTATATDADSNTLTYSLSGADADLLTIDAVTGEVRLKDSANFEAKSSYSFTVVVTDSGNLSAGKAVTVSVGDLNETPVLTSGATGSVTENAATSTVIYTATATDADSNTLTYSLSGADADLLTIDAVTGEVRLKDSANFEAKSSYSFTVVVTDSGNLSAGKAVTVSVGDLNETPVLTSGAIGSVTENVATSTVIYTATATDADSNTLTYSLSGADADLLTIDSVTGEVRLKDSANFEAKSSYSFTVVVTDSGNLSSSKAVTVSVLDVNDNSPTVTAGQASTTLVEAGGVSNAINGSDNSTVTLTKADLDTVGNVIYDTNFLLETGWSTADGGVTFSRVGTYGTATFTVASGVMSYLLNNNDSDTQSLTAGQSVSETFVIRVSDGNTTHTANAVFNIIGSNDAPTAVGAVAPLAGIIGQIFTPVTLPDNLFTDVDGIETSQLVLSIENLPAGLVFDAVTRTISGTLNGNLTGVITLQLVATDPNGAQVRIPVTMTIEPARVITPEVVPPMPAPEPVAPIAQMTTPVTVDSPTTTGLPEGTLSTLGGATGFASAPESASPGLSIGNVPAPTSAVVVNVGADGQVQITQATGSNVDSSGLTVSNIEAKTGKITILLADSGGAASFTATLADGSQLPDWVTVNPVTGEVTMTPPPGQSKVTLRINAIDANGTIRVLEVEVDLESLPETPVAERVESIQSDKVTAFMPLDQQLRIAAAQTDDYGLSVMKLLAS